MVYERLESTYESLGEPNHDRDTTRWHNSPGGYGERPHEFIADLGCAMGMVVKQKTVLGFREIRDSVLE